MEIKKASRPCWPRRFICDGINRFSSYILEREISVHRRLELIVIGSGVEESLTGVVTAQFGANHQVLEDVVIGDGRDAHAYGGFINLGAAASTEGKPVVVVVPLDAAVERYVI